MNFNVDLSYVLATILLINLVFTCIPCEGRSNGAPSEACSTLLPQHGTVQPQFTVNPYGIQVVGETQYVPGGTVTVNLLGPASSFKGFILQARRVGEITPIGSWVTSPTNTKVTTCQSTGDTITHSNTQMKSTLTFAWRAPNSNTGPVEFVATVARSFSVFWGPFKSTQITVSGSSSSGACSPNPCLNSGTCVVVGTTGFKCNCQDRFTGLTCASTLSTSQVCTPNPCQNGATCVITGTNSYRCNCRSGTTGSLCQTITQGNPCSSNPCFNGGQCSLLGTSYRCSCRIGYTGSQCQTSTQGNACSSNPCLNGGQCSVSGSIYRCTCQTGFTGLQCQTAQGTGTQLCTPNPCQNGATCVITGTNSYRCNCRSGTTGSLCQTITQGNPCSSNPCFNGGQCSLLGTSYRCSCRIGYTGSQCQTSTQGNACSSNPCLNGGQCSVSGSIYRCTCQTGFTGLQCQTAQGTGTQLCTPNPCQNGATCVITGTNSYRCNCRSGTTGSLCQTVTQGNACSSNPCLNNGQCSIIGTSYRCTCPTGYGGLQCQTAIPGNACSPNPCLNGGQCTSVGLSYQCTCQSGYAGLQCQTPTDTSTQVCAPNPCQNGATCVITGTNSYRCNCRSGTTGSLCQTVMQGNACSSSPCLNGGQCSYVGSSYVCACRTGFTGSQCQIQTSQLCTPNPCQNNGTCVVRSSSNSYRCYCRPGTVGNRCQTITQGSPCSSNPCLNGGQCLSIGSSYQCTCLTGYTGFRCQTQTDTSIQVCAPNPCQNGATCVITGTNSYRCNCRSGTTGSLCQTITQGSTCFPNPCLNGGYCSFSGSSYQCTCLTGYIGSQCQTQQNNACGSSPCLNGGQCTVVGSSYQCTCQTGFTGAQCQILVTACTTNPCQNGGQCSLATGAASYTCTCPIEFSGTRCENTACSGGPCLNSGQCSTITGAYTYQCTCQSGYSGTNCQTSLGGSCTPNPCFNGGQCQPINGGVGYLCNCPNDFTGPTCSQIRNPCSPNPCRNGGVCSSPSMNTFQCECATGWSGTDCATSSAVVCASANICRNGGTCQPNDGGSFVCQCAPGYDGISCENMISPCFPNPCLNGGTCVSSSGSSFSCNCPSSFTGITCQIIDLCDPSPCNRGTCQQVAGQSSYTCVCNPGYTGQVCNIQAFCNPSPCVNGVCTQNDATLTYSCQCNIGFTGQNCDQELIGPCAATPCLNGGICLENADKINFECACLFGYKGTLCDEAVLPVFQDCPQFQIVIVSLEPGQNFSIVNLDITAMVPDGPDPTLEIVSGPDLPGNVTYSAEYRAGREVVIRATSSAGMTSDCQFILKIIDEESPTVNCPQDITQFTYGSSDTVEWPPATASDNLAQPSELIFSYTKNSGSLFPASEESMPKSVEVTATDTFGNIGSCQFEVMMVKIPNPPVPVFSSCKEGETLTYQLRDNTNVAYVGLSIEAKDSSQQPAFISHIEGPTIDLPGDVTYDESYRNGQKFVYRALDPATELTTDCTFWIKLVDGQPPQVSCPPSIIDRTTTGTKAIFWDQVEVNDNLPLPEGNLIVYDRKNGTAFEATENGLSHLVTVTATDSFNNIGTCEFSVTLYRFDVVCEQFPVLVNGTGNCIIASDGKMECRIVCDEGFYYALVDNRFKCQITSSKAFWDPSPNVDSCTRPTAGSVISKTVSAVYPFDTSACDATNKVFVSVIRDRVNSILEDAGLCEHGYARACTDDSVTPRCGVVTASNKRRRRAFTDLTIDIKVSAPAAFTGGSSLSDVKQDVDDLAKSIKRLIDDHMLTLIIDSVMVQSVSSQLSDEYKWTCPVGYYSVTGGCVACPRGTFYNTSSEECQFCERGSYQDKMRKTTCKECPTGETTDQKGTYLSGECQSNTAQTALPWTPLLTTIVVLAVILLLILIIGVMCICTCVPSKKRPRYREKDLDGSLSNLKYLNKAYEDDYVKGRSKGLHKLTRKHNRQTSPSRSSTATGYITMSTTRDSQNHGDMVSIDSDEYRQDVHGRQIHYNHGNDIKRDSGISYGHVSTATMGSSGGAFTSHTSQPVLDSNAPMRRELTDTGL